MKQTFMEVVDLFHENTNRKDFSYWRGYNEGYIEGYNKALEKLQHEIQLAMLNRPVVMQVVNQILER